MLVPETNIEAFAGCAYIFNGLTTTATLNATQQTFNLTNPDTQKSAIVGSRVNFDNGATDFGKYTAYWGPTVVLAFTGQSTGTSETTIGQGITGSNSITTKPIVFLTGGGQISLGNLNASVSGGGAYEKFNVNTTYSPPGSTTSAAWAKWSPALLVTAGYRLHQANRKGHNYGLQADLSYYNIYENFTVQTGTSTGDVTSTYEQCNRKIYAATGGFTFYF